jgi:hypothetical protein
MLADPTITDLINKFINQVLNPLIKVLFVVVTIVFIWGIITYVAGSQGDEPKLKAGKRIMLWGIIGMFVMASAWGIVKLLCEFFETCQYLPSSTQPSSTQPAIFPPHSSPTHTRRSGPLPPIWRL